MSTEASHYRDDEKTRPCTTCRMPVSILATKCRYCGAELGRPREETRSLSAQDLGGETIKHYAPSSNVMDALESFRTEQAAQQRKSGKEGNLPELDDRSRALASAVRSSPSGPPRKNTRRFSWGDYGRYVLGGITALVLVVVAITVIPRFTTGQTEGEVFVNRAPSMMELGAAPLEILEAALDAVRQAPGAENDAIYAEARARLRQEVTGVLAAPNWSRRYLDQASRLANQASALDPHGETQELKSMVDAEVDAYNIVLAGVDASSGAVTYRMARSDTNHTATRDDLILDRFQIVRVTGNTVRLRDQRRDGRELNWSIGGQPALRQ